MPTGKQCVLHLSDSLTSAGDSRHHGCKAFSGVKMHEFTVPACKRYMSRLHTEITNIPVIDADASLSIDFWAFAVLSACG